MQALRQATIQNVSALDRQLRPGGGIWAPHRAATFGGDGRINTRLTWSWAQYCAPTHAKKQTRNETCKPTQAHPRKARGPRAPVTAGDMRGPQVVTGVGIGLWCRGQGACRSCPLGRVIQPGSAFAGSSTRPPQRFWGRPHAPPAAAWPCSSASQSTPSLQVAAPAGAAHSVILLWNVRMMTWVLFGWGLGGGGGAVGRLLE